jgi:hypothetical protein
MEAKVKAKELVGRFDNVVHSNAGSNNFDFESAAKECALICVDEILKNVILGELFYEYYEEVKEEIYKL